MGDQTLLFNAGFYQILAQFNLMPVHFEDLIIFLGYLAPIPQMSGFPQYFKEF